MNGMWKRLLALALAMLMIVGLCACGIRIKSRDDSTEEERATEETTQAAEETTAPADPTVVLPEDFGYMSYPILALMTQDYAKGLPYYGDDSSADNADSFFYSMAVLTSLMETDTPYGDGIDDGTYYFISDETFDAYASAMYSSYGESLESPEIPEDSEIVTFEEEKETVGFIKGNVSLTPYIISCVQDGTDYDLKVQLLDKESQIVSVYEVEITPTTAEDEDNPFAYAVKAFSSTTDNSGGYDFAGEQDTAQEASTETTDSTQTNTESTTTTEETADNYESSGDTISQSDARKLAENEYGEGTYNYSGQETIGSKDYYVFDYTGDSGNHTTVIVATDGSDVNSGTKNSDGSWSFGQ